MGGVEIKKGWELIPFFVKKNLCTIIFEKRLCSRNDSPGRRTDVRS